MTAEYTPQPGDLIEAHRMSTGKRERGFVSERPAAPGPWVTWGDASYAQLTSAIACDITLLDRPAPAAHQTPLGDPRRSEAAVKAEALREAADRWHAKHIGTRPDPYKWGEVYHWIAAEADQSEAGQ